MKKSEKLEQLKQLAIFAAVIAVVVAGLYVLSKYTGGGGDGYQKIYNVKVGETIVLNMPGKVSIEYRWQINKEKSTNLDLLNINHIGWIYDKDNGAGKMGTKFGTPRTAKFVAKPKGPGEVFLRFEFKRRGIKDDTPIRMREITLKISEE